MQDQVDVNWLPSKDTGGKDLLAVQEGESNLQFFRAPEWTRSTLLPFTGTIRYPQADDLKVVDLDGDGDLDVHKVTGFLFHRLE